MLTHQVRTALWKPNAEKNLSTVKQWGKSSPARGHTQGRSRLSPTDDVGPGASHLPVSSDTSGAGHALLTRPRGPALLGTSAAVLPHTAAPACQQSALELSSNLLLLLNAQGTLAPGPQLSHRCQPAHKSTVQAVQVPTPPGWPMGHLFRGHLKRRAIILLALTGVPAPDHEAPTLRSRLWR
ncbi:hypothetical protein P7K49_005968 [Saguinus oedipus]|uniref:Uncharacterized protein n=1 Tax=Saguinus oedipus TaxID=9490 RepID=A0ABQ9W4M6_SAGOE|nr:hypothetical protein P7K49_005968 [Saguinus oedipus]